MSSETTVRAEKSVAVTAIGILTILWGGIYSVLGGMLAFAGDSLWGNLDPNDPVGGFGPILKILAGLMMVIGVVWLVQGIPALFAGWGVLQRRQWGRIPTFLVALLAMFWSLFLLFSSDTKWIAIGVIEFAYGVLAFVILIAKSKEFSRTLT
jgi:hypothetical protein